MKISNKDIQYMIVESIKTLLKEGYGNGYTIALDFDGTVVTHRYPEIGRDIGAVPVLKRLVANGHRLILTTMRSRKLYQGRDLLQEAIDWFNNNGVELYAIQSHPEQASWTDSPKCDANFCIDDRNIGTPTRISPNTGRRFVDWQKMEALLEEAGLFDNEYDDSDIEDENDIDYEGMMKLYREIMKEGTRPRIGAKPNAEKVNISFMPKTKKAPSFNPKQTIKSDHVGQSMIDGRVQDVEKQKTGKNLNKMVIKTIVSGDFKQTEVYKSNQDVLIRAFKKFSDGLKREGFMVRRGQMSDVGTVFYALNPDYEEIYVMYIRPCVVDGNPEICRFNDIKNIVELSGYQLSDFGIVPRQWDENVKIPVRIYTNWDMMNKPPKRWNKMR